MKTSKFLRIVEILLLLVLIYNQGMADDSCVFMVSANDVPPNIVLLLDNGAEMEQIIWNSAYDNGIDYTPNITEEQQRDVDDVVDAADGAVASNINGFYNSNGYGIIVHGGLYYLVKILDNLLLDTYDNGLKANSGNTWTINGKSVSLPCVPSTVSVEGIIDNAVNFRYSKNYLNWIFFAVDGSGNSLYTGNGSDLPNKSRFYYAKKAVMTVAKLTSNKAYFGIYNFTSNSMGASNVQPLGTVVTTLATLPEDNILDPNFINNINNMGTVTYSPLAEGLANIGGYYASSSSGVIDLYCQKNFTIVISSGVSSKDQATASGSSPASLADYDGDGGGSGIGEGNIKKDGSTYVIPTNLDGTTYLDDIAHYLNSHDIVDYVDGFQNVYTYTIGFMGNEISNLFLINTSNNGNGNFNLYDTTDSQYGRYHFEAENPNQLSTVLLAAIEDILSRTQAFTAPVVPVTRTMSGDRLYMAFFKPRDGNFWEGNVAKYGIDSQNQIVDSNGNAATQANGAIKDESIAPPYWATKNWADSSKANYIANSARNIYTYLDSSSDSILTSANEFISSNSNLTAALLGSPTHTTAEIINYIRGADVFDDDIDGNTTENRDLISGDVLHSEPLIVRYDSSTARVYFGANDGMVHSVSDSNGIEAWAFIPPDQLHRLKNIVECSDHQYFIDSSPKAYIKDINKDGTINSGAGDQVILVCGERKGGASYFALDVTQPDAPRFLWRINSYGDADGVHSPIAPDTIISELGESWSEPQFGLVKTSAIDTVGTPVFFIGCGYSSDNSTGNAVAVINVLTGSVIKLFKNGINGITDMNYSIVSSVAAIDADSNGFVDKLYVGDLGGRMWRFGRFTDAWGNLLAFPNCDENINNWTGQIIFYSDTGSPPSRKFFYPPSITLEENYDLVCMGTGDRENACSTTSSDRIYAVKDSHGTVALEPTDLIDVTYTDYENPAETIPDMDGNDQGWYIDLAAGEKVLAEGTVFYKVFYVTTFTPNNDPCLPGGLGKIYALQYKTGAAVLPIDSEDKARSFDIGGGIPSKPVTVISQEGQKLLISVGSTLPEITSDSVGTGIVGVDPDAPNINFFYLWWNYF